MDTQESIPNPLRAWKDALGLTYVEVAERLGISEHYARKLGVDLAKSMSRRMMRQLEQRSDGAITVDALTRWVDAHAERAA